MPKSQPKTFTSALVPFILSAAQREGADVAKLQRRLAEAGVRGPGPVTIAQLSAILEAAAECTGDPLFGVHLAQALPRGAYGLLEFAIRSAPTGRAAMEQLVAYGALINPIARFSLSTSAGEVSLHHHVPSGPTGLGRQGNLYTVVRMLTMGRELVGDWLLPRRAWFAHRERRCPEELQQVLGTGEIQFARSSNGLTFCADVLEAPLPSADGELNAVLRQHAAALLVEVEREDLFSLTRRALLELIPKGKGTLPAVARQLKLGERTFQRRLSDQGLSFASLVSEVRLELAQQLLRVDDAPLSELAERLGFADAGAFVRAFKRWTGKTPGRYREELRAVVLGA